MRVYASSYRFGSRAGRLSVAGSRALIVMNAADGYADRLLTLPREADALAAIGLASTELDLRDFWGADPRSLAERLATAGLLWVIGGNAFTLARAATAAGLRDALDLVPDMIVGGYSAGACLTGVDLAGIEVMDDAAELPPGYDTAVPARTLDLTGHRIVPHDGTADAEAAGRVLDSAGLPYLRLADGEDLFFGEWADPSLG